MSFIKIIYIYNHKFSLFGPLPKREILRIIGRYRIMGSFKTGTLTDLKNKLDQLPASFGPFEDINEAKAIANVIQSHGAVVEVIDN